MCRERWKRGRRAFSVRVPGGDSGHIQSTLESLRKGPFTEMLWVWREPVRKGRELGRGRSEKPKAKVREWVPASRKWWMGATAGHRGARAGGYVLHSLSSGLGPPVSASWVSRSQSQGIDLPCLLEGPGQRCHLSFFSFCTI